MYLSYALFCEGSSDFDYFEVLIARLIDTIVAERGRFPVDVPTAPSVRLGGSGRSVDAVADEACAKREAALITFIHADTGGRSQERTLDQRSVAYCARMREVCGFRPARCVLVRPRREMEAWALADRNAVLDAFGYRDTKGDIGLPKSARAAERLTDPKETLRTALRQLSGRRSHDLDRIFPAIAQRQSIDMLRRAQSFAEFEDGLATALKDVGAI